MLSSREAGVAPLWLEVLACTSVALGLGCALFVAADIAQGHRQPMWIMNLVWPLTMLYAGPLGLWFYFRARAGHPQQGRSDKLGWTTVAKATTHCGAGCTLGDLLAEWFTVLVPLRLFGQETFGTWLLDFAAAFGLGIAFQYFSIKPMRQLSPRDGLLAALKADSLSLTAWQLGMYGWMALVLFVLFPVKPPKTTATFWFMMQLAMLAGFATSYPLNRWLLRRGIKEAM